MTGGQAQYGALAAKVKALYGKRLRFSDFEHMAGLPNEQSILDYLRSQQFKVIPNQHLRTSAELIGRLSGLMRAGRSFRLRSMERSLRWIH